MQPSVSVIMLCSPGRDAMRARAIASIRRQTYSPIQIVTHESRTGVSIGTLRNEAVERCFGDIIVHADDDDVSHECRVEEQVALLQASGADAVGYSEAVFWDTRAGQFCGAYTYTGIVPRFDIVGASLCYWRKTWERVKFTDVNQGEDVQFVKRVKALGVSGIDHGCCDPRIICAIHSDSTTKETPALGSSQWKRAPEFDSYCREKMKL